MRQVQLLDECVITSKLFLAMKLRGRVGHAASSHTVISYVAEYIQASS